MWHLGPLPAARLRPVHHRRHRRRRLLIGSAGSPGAAPRRRARHRGLGGAVRHHRRPDLPRHHHPAGVLRRGRRPADAPSRSGRAASASGARSPRRRRRLDRLPAPGHPAAGLRRRPRPRAAAGPGDRPARQLVQPGALRPPHRPAVGPGDRPGAPAGTAYDGTSPPSTRRSSTSCCGTSAARRAPDLGRPALPARARPCVRAVRRGLLRRPALDRAAAHRRGQPVPRHPAQRVHRRRRRPAPPWPTSSAAWPAREVITRGEEFAAAERASTTAGPRTRRRGRPGPAARTTTAPPSRTEGPTSAHRPRDELGDRRLARRGQALSAPTRWATCRRPRRAMRTR